MGRPDPTSRRDWIRRALADYEGRLVRYAGRLTGDVDRARDVVQEAFSRLCREDPASLNGRLEAWLYTVCRNAALDDRRKQQRVVRLADAAAETIEGAAPSPAETTQRRQAVSRLMALVETLPPREQEVIRLKFQEGLRYRQIAEVMDLSVGNVGYLIHTAINRLREKMRDE